MLWVVVVFDLRKRTGLSSISRQKMPPCAAEVVLHFTAEDVLRFEAEDVLLAGHP